VLTSTSAIGNSRGALASLVSSEQSVATGPPWSPVTLAETVCQCQRRGAAGNGGGGEYMGGRRALPPRYLCTEVECSAADAEKHPQAPAWRTRLKQHTPARLSTPSRERRTGRIRHWRLRPWIRHTPSAMIRIVLVSAKELLAHPGRARGYQDRRLQTRCSC